MSLREFEHTRYCFGTKYYEHPETRLEPLITGFKSVCIDLKPQIIHFPLVFEAAHNQKPLYGYVKQSFWT